MILQYKMIWKRPCLDCVSRHQIQLHGYESLVHISFWSYKHNLVAIKLRIFVKLHLNVIKIMTISLNHYLQYKYSSYLYVQVSIWTLYTPIKDEINDRKKLSFGPFCHAQYEQYILWSLQSHFQTMFLVIKRDSFICE